ncbi:MAG: hypothetical protein WD266_00195 [Balneolales bacterium]
METAFSRSAENAEMANEGLTRSQRLVDDWLDQTDPRTGLIPRNLWESGDQSEIWNPKDAAADNFPFLYLTAHFTDPALSEGRMLDMLFTETALTSRVDRIPDVYSFRKQDFLHDDPDPDRIIFGAAEYIKDGLIVMTELLGPGPWHSRMAGILDDMLYHMSDGPVLFDTFDEVVNMEINGELLQVLSRVYWMTEDDKYLDFALQIADYYLLGDHHPTRDFDRLRLRDHGGEIVSGLTELYATLHYANSEKAQRYREPLHEMLDRILEAGSNEDGMLYNEFNPQTGEILDQRLADTWGYVLNGHYTVYLLDGIDAYREAAITALENVIQYQQYNWESGSADGDADVVEGALYLYNREPVPDAAEWMDRQMAIMWSKQDSAQGRERPEGKWRQRGVVEGWHGDGNFARTSLMHALWKSQGTSIRPWREDILLGAVMEENDLIISVSATDDWTGRLVFDRQRHRDYLNLPLDWPRLNSFSEWFTADPDRQYAVNDLSTGQEVNYSGAELHEGIRIRMDAGEEKRYIVRAL